MLYLLRASLLQPSPTGANGLDRSERFDALKQATKCFDDALRASGGKNMMAVLGKARVHFTLGKYAEALQAYQTVLERVPDMTDPDPRIGVGCCLWQLGHTDDAKLAWERALELVSRNNLSGLRELSNFITEPRLQNCKYFTWPILFALNFPSPYD